MELFLAVFWVGREAFPLKTCFSGMQLSAQIYIWYFGGISFENRNIIFLGVCEIPDVFFSIPQIIESM